MYCTVNDVLELIPLQTLISLTQDDPSVHDFDVEIVNSAIKYGSDKIDASIRGRYSLPLPQKVDLLKGYNLDYARYWLYARRPNGGELPEAVKEGKKSAETDLSKISRGEMSLGIEGSKEAVDEPGPWRVKARPRRFGDINR